MASHRARSRQTGGTVLAYTIRRLAFDLNASP
jgi:hypothetical protein